MAYRILRFRVWDSEKQLFTYPSTIDINYEDEEDYDEDLDPKCMQYTGIKDKNDRPIYEGDICEGHHEGTGEIIWSAFDGGYEYKIKDGNLFAFEELIEWGDLEIIGNIYETPELRPYIKKA